MYASRCQNFYSPPSIYIKKTNLSAGEIYASQKNKLQQLAGERSGVKTSPIIFAVYVLSDFWEISKNFWQIMCDWLRNLKNPESILEKNKAKILDPLYLWEIVEKL